MPLALLALAVGAFGIGTTEFVMMGLLPDVADDLHISIPTAGHLVSAYALGVVIGAPLLAAVTARLSRRTVLIGLMVLFVAGNVALGLRPRLRLAPRRPLPERPAARRLLRRRSRRRHGLVAPERKARSVSLMFLGLTVANIVGVPAGHAGGPEPGLARHVPRRERDRPGGHRVSGAGADPATTPRPRGRPARRAGGAQVPPGLAGPRHHGRGLRRALLGVQLHHADAHGRRRASPTPA
jgi:hypothetical protein